MTTAKDVIEDLLTVGDDDYSAPLSIVENGEERAMATVINHHTGDSFRVTVQRVG